MLQVESFKKKDCHGDGSYNDEIDGKKLILDGLKVNEKLVEHLLPHQIVGVKFMWNTCFESIQKAKNSNGTGCILSHCMGLGEFLFSLFCNLFNKNFINFFRKNHASSYTRRYIIVQLKNDRCSSCAHSLSSGFRSGSVNSKPG